jgi:hypothetical protein
LQPPLQLQQQVCLHMLLLLLLLLLLVVYRGSTEAHIVQLLLVLL